MDDLLACNVASGSPQLDTDIRTLLLVQKAELVGELTSAMANQFNNIMMAITGYADLEMKKLPTGERRSLEQIVSNATRATALVEKLVALSRKHVASPQPLDLNDLLDGIRNLLERLAGDRFSLAFSFAPVVPSINADPVEIEQALLALVINARNASVDGGEIKISTQSVEVTEDGLPKTERPGQYVLLSIDAPDPGRVGKDREPETCILDQHSRISLSLAAIGGIARGAGGFVRFSTRPGEGSSFKIYFRALEKVASEERERSSRRNVPLARTILIVDDDDSVRIPAAEFLKMEGFKVLQAKTGAEAIHVALLHNHSCLDILITDVVMPKMNGHEVAEKLLELHPGLKVLYVSGDVAGIGAPHVAGLPQMATLRKPFRLDSLKDNIHELLGE